MMLKIRDFRSAPKFLEKNTKWPKDETRQGSPTLRPAARALSLQFYAYGVAPIESTPQRPPLLISVGPTLRARAHFPESRSHPMAPFISPPLMAFTRFRLKVSCSGRRRCHSVPS